MQLYSNTALPTIASATVGQFGMTYTQLRRNVYTNSMAADDIPNLSKLVEEVERDLLSHIYANLKTKDITAVDAQKIAQDFLKLLPFKDKKDLLDKLNALGNTYRTAQEVYVKFGVPYEEQERQRKLDLMREHIKNGEIDKALEVAKEHVANQNGVSQLNSPTDIQRDPVPLDNSYQTGSGKGGDQNGNSTNT